MGMNEIRLKWDLLGITGLRWPVPTRPEEGGFLSGISAGGEREAEPQEVAGSGSPLTSPLRSQQENGRGWDMSRMTDPHPTPPPPPTVVGEDWEGGREVRDRQQLQTHSGLVVICSTLTVHAAGFN